MEISVKDFSEITRPRILKFGTKLGNEQLYCVLKNQPHIAYKFLYFFNFSFSLTKFSITDFSASFWTGSLNFIYTMKTTKCITENKTKMLRFIFAFFFYFPFFYLSLLCDEYGNFLSNISQDLLDLEF